MKLKKKVILVFVILLFCIGVTTNLYASNELKISEDTTEDYKKWEELSSEEKKKYIQPSRYSVDISSSATTSSQDNRKIKVKSSVLPSSYSLKDKISLMVRDQQSTGQCWAFTTTNLISTNIQKVGLSSTFIPFSTRHMEYTTSRTFLDGINSKGYYREVGDGGNVYIGLNYCTAGYGPVLESDMPFKDDENQINLSQIEGKEVSNKINEYIKLPSIYKKIVNDKIVYYNGLGSTSEKYEEYIDEQVQSARNKIKQQIVNNGGISTQTYIDPDNNSKYFDTNNLKTAKSYYCYDNNIIANHAVTIIGWDDEYKIENFDSTNQPKNKGAYIILNSHGTDYYDNGYMYVSYDDVLIERDLVGITQTTTKDYDNIYQYDELGYNARFILDDSDTSDVSTAYIANVFKSKNSNANKKEYLNEVSLYIPVEQEIDIYVNLKNADKTDIKLVKSCGQLEVGYHTIKLDDKLEISGDEFVIAAKYKNNNGNVAIPFEMNFNDESLWDTASSQEGQSYYSSNGQNWNDISAEYTNTNCCLKAFTVEEDNTQTTNNSDNENNTNTNSTTNTNNVDTTQQTNSVGVTYQAHVENIGWQNFVSDEEIAGTSGQSLRVEALKIKLIDAPTGGKIKYQSHVQNIGWQSWKSDGELTGTSGQSLRVEALKIKLENMPDYTVQYRVHIQNIGWQEWKTDGEMAGTSGQSLRIEAIQIRILKKCNMVTYQAHVENIGWQNFVSDGEIAGTSGQSLRVEALRIKLVEAPTNAKITYQAHVQNIGWQGWKSEGELAGTSGQSLRVEALKIKLENMPNYIVQYRVHIQNIGWQGWRSDGEIAGTSGQSLRIEAIQIRILEKRSN